MGAKHKLALVFGLAILVLGGLLCWANLAQQEPESTETTLSLSDFASADIEAFGYTWQGENLSFAQREQVVESDPEESEESDPAQSQESDTDTQQEPETELVWYLTQEPEYQLDQSTISSMLTALSTLTAQRQLEQAAPEYGLEEPELTIWVTVNGQTTTWNCGITNTMTQSRYLQKQGESSVYLVSASSLNLFESTQQELGAVVSQ